MWEAAELRPECGAARAPVDQSVEQAAQVELMLGDWRKLLDNFWTSWSTLSSNPSSQAAKDGVVGAAQNLAGRFQSLDGDLATSAQQATDAISDMLSDAGPIKPIVSRGTGVIRCG